MSDALLKNTFNKISPAYELVADVTVSVATTQVDFSGLNFGKDDDLLLVGTRVVGVTLVSNADLRLYVNNNTTNTNYYYQQLYASNTTVASERANTNRFLRGNLGSHFSITKLKLTNSGYFVTQEDNQEAIGSTMALNNRYMTSTFTMGTIIQLTISAGEANGIGIGSRFQLYRLKAKKVADIIVGSATTQVDITGLSIDKDSEYMLVSDLNNTSVSTSGYFIFANANTIQTNYYRQGLTSDGNGVSSGRGNDNYCAICENANKTLVFTKIKLTNNGYYVIQNETSRKYGGSAIILAKYYNTSTYTMTSITQLSIISEVANGIGIGSRFTLYKMK